MSLLKQEDVNLRPLLESAQVTCSVDALLSGAIHGLSPEQLAQVNSLAMEALASLANRQDGRPLIRPDDWAMLFYCLISSRTLREVISRTSRFFRMLEERWGAIDLHVQGTHAEIRSDSRRVRRNAVAFVVDVTGLAVLHSMFSWLIGETIPLTHVSFAYDEELLPYFDNTAFPCPVTLGAARTSLQFSAEFLDFPVVRTLDDYDRRAPAFLFTLQEDGAPSGIAEQARRVMYMGLRDRRELPTLEDVAAALDCTVATLRRNLTRAGASYNVLKNSCRRELALDLLRRTTLDMEQISIQLGFCDSDAFRRAFREWMNTSPLQYRRHGLSKSPRKSQDGR